MLYHFYVQFAATVHLPAEKFHDTEDSPTVMALDKKEQIILHSGEELFAEIR